jgi:hypothetical protein
MALVAEALGAVRLGRRLMGLEPDDFSEGARDADRSYFVLRERPAPRAPRFLSGSSAHRGWDGFAGPPSAVPWYPGRVSGG